MFKRYLYRNYRSAGGLSHSIGRRITPVGRVVIMAAVITGALGTDTTVSIAYQTFSFLLCLIVVSWVSLLWSRRSVEVERILPKFGSAGESMPYVAVLRNRSKRFLRSLALIENIADPRPTFEQFANIPEPGEEKRNWFDRLFGVYRWRWLVSQGKRLSVEELPLPDLPPGSMREVHWEMMPLRRGVARLEGAMIACPEPFGLFRALRKVRFPQTVLILPKRYRMPPFEMPGATKYQQGGVSMASSVGESEEFVSLRDYRPGDPLRRIHWKSFAKAGRPVVKEFQDEFFVRHAFVLDTFSKERLGDVFEEAVSVAASLAYTIQDHDSLLDLMFVGPQAYCFTSGRGVGQMERMLEILAAVQTCADKEFVSLETLVMNHITNLSGCLCVFVDWDEPRHRFVQMLQSRGVPLRVFVITAGDKPLHPGPMAQQPEHFHILPVGKIEERLARL